MTLSETHSPNNVSLSDDDSEILRRRPPIITGPTFSLKGHPPVDTKSASSAAVGICRRGDSHDDPRSGSLSSSSDSGGIIAEDGNVVVAGGGGMTLSGRKKRRDLVCRPEA